MTTTPEMLATMRQRAEQDQVLFNPQEVLALLDRIEVLETALRTVGPEFLAIADKHTRRIEEQRNRGDNA